VGFFSDLFSGGSSKRQAAAIRETSQQSVAAQKEFFGKAEQAVKPFMQFGSSQIGALNTALSGLQGFTGQFQGLADQASGLLNPQVQSLLGQVNTSASTTQAFSDLQALGESPTFSFDPNDPAYRFQQEELNKSLNQQLSSIGLRRSGRGAKIVSRENQALLAQEVGRQRDRQLTDFLTRRDTLTQRLGLSAGIQGEQFGRGIQGLGASIQGLGAQQGLIQSALGAQLGQVGALSNAVGIGADAAGTLGRFATGTGANIGKTHINTGQSLVGIEQQAQAERAGLFGAILQTVGQGLGSFQGFSGFGGGAGGGGGAPSSGYSLGANSLQFNPALMGM